MLAAAGVAIALTRKDGSDTGQVASRSTTSTASTATTAAGSSTTSPPAALPPAQAKVIDEIRGQVAELRGLQWKTPLDVAILPRNDFQQELKRVNDRDRHADRQTGDGETYKLLKLIPRSLNYDKALEDLYGSAVVGFYDPKTKKLLIGANGGTLDPAARLTIAHEMDHALTDQHFNFGERTNTLDIGDKQEELQGFIGLLEGDAKVMESLWSTKYLTAKERQTLTSSGDLTAFYRSPKYLRDSLLYPYTSGQAWALRLYQQTKSWRLIDAAYADPPRSTEEVLHLDRYEAKPRRGWSPPQLPPLTAGTDCAAVRSGTIGEFNMIELLDQNLTLNDAAVSADGWNGDAFQVVRCGTALAMVDRWEADDATAAGRLADGLARWAREWSGGTPPGSDGRFTGSAGSGRIVRNGTRVDLVLADDAPSADKVAAAAGVA